MPNILVIAEHDEGQLKLATFSAVACARKIIGQAGGSFDLLVLGDRIGGLAEALRPYGAAAVCVADAPQLKHPLSDRYAQLVAEAARQRGAELIVGAASTFAKDILPRAAGLLDAGMLSDVIDAKLEDNELIFRRVMYAGNVIATVKLEGAIRCLTVRAAAFPQAAKLPDASPVIRLPVIPDELPALTAFESRTAKVAGRPDSTEARVVVSGGRAIKSAEDFERMIGGLADALGGAVGSSRALVDSGITPNSLQVGQTGKIVAPDLYLAVGISGAIQHLAGMKDAKVIVAINKDPDAPIFEVADFSLVADVYTVVPELVSRLKK